jgi:hypothetical protein
MRQTAHKIEPRYASGGIPYLPQVLEKYLHVETAAEGRAET